MIALGLVAGGATEAKASAREALRTEKYGQAVLSDVGLLEAVGAEVLAVESETGVGFAQLSKEQQERLTHLAHDRGACAGFEALPYRVQDLHGFLLDSVFGELKTQALRNKRFTAAASLLGDEVQFNQDIDAMLKEVSETNLRDSVAFLSSFKTRSYQATDADAPILAFKARIEAQVQGAKVPVKVELIKHSRIKQSSIRATITGSKRPSEIIALGGHVDSINQSWMGGRDAPGADDNASGSSNILEALRVIAHSGIQPERTLEFFWYAGEEGGLIGSGEIAAEYKKQNKDVVAVLQLDMTSFPGDGEFTLGSMSDFTSAWLRTYLVSLNSVYIKARIIDDKCGYGCSDHASWHRQGYPALMPFEASFSKSNKKIHTDRDRIDNDTSFRHSAIFSRIAVAMAMDLGNSQKRQSP